VPSTQAQIALAGWSSAIKFSIPQLDLIPTRFNKLGNHAPLLSAACRIQFRIR